MLVTEWIVLVDADDDSHIVIEPSGDDVRYCYHVHNCDQYIICPHRLDMPLYGSKIK